jgi:hypothetical protein
MAQSEHPRHPSVQALLSEAASGEDAHAVIRRKARTVVAKARSLWKGPPFCPFALADIEGIIVERAPCDIRSDGRIFPKGEQVYIQYTDGPSIERIRFTICHELAHTLFPDCFKRERRRSPAEKAEREFEDLCNAGAAEFLFPLEEFTLDIGGAPLTAGKLQALSTRYEASVDATARRFVNLYPAPACVVFAEYREPKPGKVVSLFVQYAVANGGFKTRFFKGGSINSKSVANRAYTERKPLAAATESWIVHGKWARFRVEAVPLPKFQSKLTADVAILLYPK